MMYFAVKSKARRGNKLICIGFDFQNGNIIREKKRERQREERKEVGKGRTITRKNLVRVIVQD